MAVKQSLATFALAVALLACGGSTPSPRVRTQFLSGTPAPPGLTFASFGRAAANARGTVCFLAGWDGLRHRAEGLFLRQDAQVTPIARAGEPVPGGTGGRFSFSPDYPDDFASFSLNGQDEVAFVVRQGLFFYSGGTVRPIARVGDPFPGVPDERWDEIDTVSLNSAGTIAFTGAIRSTTDGERQEGVFLASGDSVKIALFDGDQPGDLEGTLNSFAAVSLNEAGQMAVLATEGDDYLGCILSVTDAETRAVAVEGKPAPGGVWSSLSSAALNNKGDIAFQARVTGDTGEHSGIFRASEGTLTAVAIPGTAVGTDSDSVIGDTMARPIIDDVGTIAFLAVLAGSRPAHALVLARSGQQASLAVEGAQGSGDGQGAISRFSGLSLGSLSPAGLVCGVSFRGGSIADALLRFRPGRAPEALLTTATPLPAGSLLTLADGETPARNVQARINRSGELVFAADVGGYGRALFRMGANGPELLTPLNRPRFGDPGIRSVISFDLNDAGQVAYLGTRDEADEEMAVLSFDLHDGAAARRIAATGDAVPGTPGRALTRLGPPAIDGSGEAFIAAVGRSTSVAAAVDASYLLRSRGNQLQTAVSEGQSIDGAGTLAAPPGSDSGVVAPLFRELHVNRAGQALFMSSYLDQKTHAFNPSGLFVHSDGVVRPVVLPGQLAPLTGGPFYTGFSSPRFGDNGAVIFAATVAGAGRKPRAGLFQRDSTGATTVAATGDPVPGWEGISYRAILDPAANATGGVAFVGLVDLPPATATGAALFIASGLSTRTVLLDGDPLDEGGLSTLRVDDRFPPAPLALQDDGTLLVAAQVRGGTAPVGLFLILPK